ncbi:MAG: hypothetical protein K0R57_1072 [Paenibacillaceae bacterium]|jgi:hypothetical protein|nr:hypothetical protein [Paenibacillaceae bacterium]
MGRDEKEIKLMAKPIKATPVLKGQDLIDLVQSLSKKDSADSQAKRKSALASLRKVRK